MQLKELQQLKTAEHVAAAFGYSYSDFAKLIYRHPAQAYRLFEIPKRSGGFRQIAAPRPELKQVQRQLLSALTEAYKPTRSAFGFVSKRSILGNASRHVRRGHILNVDLKDFFHAITFSRVRGIFMSTAFGLPYRAATVLAQVCCYKGRLPQGAPTSPIISNFACTRMDRQIGAMAGSNGARYSRYCDDLTLSFDNLRAVNKFAVLREESGLALSTLFEGIILENGFETNNSKLKLRAKTERQEVTGLIVNERVNVRRSIVRQVRTLLHCADRFGEEAAAAHHFDKLGVSKPVAAFGAKIRGLILFVKMVRGDGDRIFASLARQYNGSSVSRRKIKYHEQVNSTQQLNKALWIVEVEYDDSLWGSRFSQGTAFTLRGKGIVTSAHVVIDPISKRPYGEIFLSRVDSPMRKHRTYVASYDPRDDLAILYLDGVDYQSLCDVQFLASRESVSRDQYLYVAGFPEYRFGQSVFKGNTQATSINGDMIEIDHAIRGGISGGPLLDSGFGVVGVLVKGIPEGSSKNEAIAIKHLYKIDFRHQDISMVEFPPPGPVLPNLHPPRAVAVRNVKARLARFISRFWRVPK